MKNKPNYLIIAVIVIAAFLLGSYLSKNSPKNIAINNSATTSDETQVDSSGHSDSHHSGGSNVSVSSVGLNALIGNPLPEIQLADKDGKIYTAESIKGKTTVLFFNEGLMCYPACWNQIAGFGSDSRFDTDQIQALSIVVDPSKDWQKAISQMPELAKAKTLFDVDANVSKKLGILTLPSSMHIGSLPGHTYIVIDKNGIVRHVFDDPNMAIHNNQLIAEISKFN